MFFDSLPEQNPTKELYLTDIASSQVVELTSGLLQDIKALVEFLKDAFVPQLPLTSSSSTTSGIKVTTSVSPSVLKLNFHSRQSTRPLSFNSLWKDNSLKRIVDSIRQQEIFIKSG
jgi:hypothetical protein